MRTVKDKRQEEETLRWVEDCKPTDVIPSDWKWQIISVLQIIIKRLRRLEKQRVL